MTRTLKTLEKMKNNPRDWRIDDVRTVARHFGVEWTRPAGGSSHETYRDRNGNKITVVDKRPIKPVYIIKFVEFIEELNDDKKNEKD
jgi:hypothetical protein